MQNYKGDKGMVNSDLLYTAYCGLLFLEGGLELENQHPTTVKNNNALSINHGWMLNIGIRLFMRSMICECFKVVFHCGLLFVKH